MLDFEYRAPDTVDELCTTIAELGEDARVIAGGTALVLLMKQRLLQPSVLVSLKRLSELAELGVENGHLRIGASATQRAVENHPLIRQHIPALSETLRRVATPRVRNQATLGGNLAHADPNQDPPATLITLDASVLLRSNAGERTIPLADFFVDYYETSLRPGEVLTQILVPLPRQDASCTFLKFLPRTSDDYATAAVAANVRLEGGLCRDVRIALGSAGPTPLRASAAESILEGSQPSDDRLREAGEAAAAAADPLSDVRGSADYKRQMIRVFTQRAVRAAVSRLSPAL